jgi:hypothetical protein
MSWLIPTIILLWWASSTAAAEWGWREAGVRMGIQAGPKHEYFHLYEAFAVYGTPWEWRTASGWGLATRLNTAAGALHGGTETGFIGSLGPGLVFNKRGQGITLEGGGDLSLLDRRQFGRQDFGSILLWGAYIGLSYRFSNGLGVGYRIRHLSDNKILYSSNTPNPGVDMHMIGLSWSF